jgi:hypothetical protein
MSLAPRAAGLDRHAFEPRDFGSALELAEQLIKSGLLPRAVSTPQAGLALVMFGRDLGLSAMQSLRLIHVIDQRPCLSAEGMVGVVLASGLAEYVRTIRSTDTLAEIETKRRGAPEPERTTWTIEDAQRAKLADKPIWRQYPRAMLLHRAQAELCRRVFSDVVGGIYTTEEVQSMGSRVEVETVTAAPAPALTPPPTVIDVESVSAQEPKPEPKAPPPSQQTSIAAQALAAVPTIEDFAALNRRILLAVGDRKGKDLITRRIGALYQTDKLGGRSLKPDAELRELYRRTEVLLDEVETEAEGKKAKAGKPAAAEAEVERVAAVAQESIAEQLRGLLLGHDWHHEMAERRDPAVGEREVRIKRLTQQLPDGEARRIWTEVVPNHLDRYPERRAP